MDSQIRGQSEELFKHLPVDTDIDPTVRERLLEAITGHGLIPLRQRLKLFLGHKLAEEVAVEAGLAEMQGMDEDMLSELKRFMGYAAATGITLRENRTTEPTHIAEAKAKMMEEIPHEHIPLLERASDIMISRGMEFHEEEWGQETPKAEAWIIEFKELYFAKPE